MASGGSPSKRDSAGGSSRAVCIAPAFYLASFTFYSVWIWNSMARPQPQDSYLKDKRGGFNWTFNQKVAYNLAPTTERVASIHRAAESRL